MNNTPKPSEIVLMASGAIMFLFSFFAFIKSGTESKNAWSGDIGTLFMATWPALFGLIVAGAVAAKVFGNVKLPDDVLGFTFTQVTFVLAFTSFIIMFGYLIGGGFPSYGGNSPDKGFGQILMLLGSVGLLAGAVMALLDTKNGSTAPGGAPRNQGGPGAGPTPF